MNNFSLSQNEKNDYRQHAFLQMKLEAVSPSPAMSHMNMWWCLFTCCLILSFISCGSEPSYINPDPGEKVGIEDQEVASIMENVLILGTEAFTPHPSVSTEDLTIDWEKIFQTENAVNDILHVSDVKYRMDQFMMARDEQGNFLPYVYVIDKTTCRADPDKGWVSLELIASRFIANGWTMYPMFSQQNQYGVACRRTLTEEIIADYVAWIDWFMDYFTRNDVVYEGKNHGRLSVGYIEPGNNPAHNWFDHVTETAFASYDQLVDQQNRVYDMMKSNYPYHIVTSPGFEFFIDTDDPDDWAINLLTYFLDSANGAKYDGLAIHTYPLRAKGFQSGPFFFAAPTEVPLYNPYGNIAGCLALRDALDESGWEDRKIYATEEWLVLTAMDPTPQPFDELWAAFNVQSTLLRATLKHNDQQVLSAVNSMLIAHHASFPNPSTWGSLSFDGEITQHLQATGFLWDILRSYDHNSHVSGDFGLYDTVWVEKFNKGDTDELYVLFKPFQRVSRLDAVAFDGEALPYSIDFDRMAETASVCDMFGNLLWQEENVNVIQVEAENRPMYVAVSFP